MSSFVEDPTARVPPGSRKAQPRSSRIGSTTVTPGIVPSYAGQNGNILWTLPKSGFALPDPSQLDEAKNPYKISVDLADLAGNHRAFNSLPFFHAETREDTRNPFAGKDAHQIVFER